MTPKQRPAVDGAWEVLRRAIVGDRLTQSIRVAAKLGIADVLAAGPRHVDEIASTVGAHAPSLYRVLRLLAGHGIFAEDAERRFALTAPAGFLRSDAPTSLRWRAIMEGEPWVWRVWGDVLDTVRTGEPAFDRVHGQSYFDYLASHPDAAAIFNATMTAGTHSTAQAVAAAYGLTNGAISGSGPPTIVDVGGGHGALLAAMLRANPRARGILFDTSRVLAGAPAELAAAGVVDRCELIDGDFFAALPAGDLYLLKFILHDWDDERSIRILRNCRRATRPGGRVLIVETLLPPDNSPDYGRFLDVNMLVLLTGRERTEAEYSALLEAADFRLARVIPTDTELGLIEGIARTDGPIHRTGTPD